MRATGERGSRELPPVSTVDRRVPRTARQLLGRGSGHLWRQHKPERQAVRPIPNPARRAESSKDALKERGERDNYGGAHDRSVTSYMLLFLIL